MTTIPARMDDPAYAPAILEHVRAGEALVTWATVASAIPGHTATFRVFSDALRIRGVRCGVSAALAQQIADLLDCRLLTPKLADLAWQARAVTLVPYPLTQTAEDVLRMTLWTTAERESALIDQAIGKSVPTLPPASPASPAASPPAPSPGAPGLVQTVGKHWTLDNDLLTHPGRAQNYGWHFDGASFGGSAWEPAVTAPLRVIQGRGWAHPPSHVDYSQTCVLVWRTCVVDGAQANLDAVLQSPTLAALASAQGPLRLLRQPGVPVPDGPVSPMTPAMIPSEPAA